ncbi:MAG: T9SS type A sorting domain-containing protein, partial [Bacteroidia bacterium]
ETVSKTADTTVIKDTTVIIKDTSDISGGDTTTSRDTITTSVMANQSIRKQVNLYPNPANNYVRLYFGENGMLPIKEASAVSALGHEIKVGFSNNEVDTSNLNDGMYFLRIRLANNQTFIQKLLKQSH